jgi:hypothetical protein
MRLINFAFAVYLIFQLSSCSVINYGSAYDANALNIPLHKEKNEVKGSVGYGSVLGFNADVSYAATSKISVKVAGNYNHQYLVRNRLFGGNHFDLENHYLEGGLGYYKYRKDAFFNSMEGSGGYGNGLTFKKSGDRFDGNYHKYFLQVNMGHVKDKLEFGFGLRYSGLFYPVLKHEKRNREFMEPEAFTYKNLFMPSLEWATFFSAGSNRLKATTQFGIAIPLKEKSFLNRYQLNNSSFSYWSAIFNIGIRYNFSLPAKS